MPDWTEDQVNAVIARRNSRGGIRVPAWTQAQIETVIAGRDAGHPYKMISPSVGHTPHACGILYRIVRPGSVLGPVIGPNEGMRDCLKCKQLGRPAKFRSSHNGNRLCRDHTNEAARSHSAFG